MAKAKYKRYYERMVEQNQELFNDFKDLHNRYEKDQDNLQEEFNQQGEKIMNLVHEWENKLCMQSEKGGYGSFTTKLAEKFQNEVKKHFPLIDHVGLIVIPPEESAENDVFEMKQIKLL